MAKRISFKEGVRKACEKEAEEFAVQDKADWLNKAKIYRQGAYLSEAYKRVARQIFNELDIKGYKVDQKFKDFEILLANLLSVRLDKRPMEPERPISVSLDRNNWQKTRYSQASYSTTNLIQILKSRGLIEMANGFRKEKNSKNTRIWPTSLLLEYFQLMPQGVLYKPVELVELRDDQGKLKDYKDTARTRRIRSILSKANAVNDGANITYDGQVLSVHLKAIFKNKLTLYGRLHTSGFRHYRHYQGLDEEERAEIMINGEPVVELDFSGLHPRLLYAKEGIQFNDDPYAVVENNPIARPYLKQILLALLNAKDETAAERAGNYILKNDHKLRKKLQKIGITRARPMIKGFKKAHSPIAHYFCSGKETGMKIMNKDSQIALYVIKHFASQKKPILAVHDSFIVQKKYRDELYEVMDEAYRRHTGGFTCLIK